MKKRGNKKHLGKIELVGNGESNLFNLFFIIFIVIITCVVVPFAINSGPIDSQWTSKASNEGWISFWGSYLGGLFGGAGTLIAVIVTTQQARDHQKENLKETRLIQQENTLLYVKQGKRIFTNEIESLIAKYITEIGMYFYAQTSRNHGNPPEINRKEAIHSFRLLEIKLENVDLAKELLIKIRLIHNRECFLEDGEDVQLRSDEFEDSMDKLKELTIKFSQKYNEI